MKIKIKKEIMRSSFLVLSLILISTVVNSQTLKETIRMADNQRYESAKISFRRLIQAEPNNGTYYYYLGETYFNQVSGDTSKLDSANMMYKKGLELEPANPLNLVGLGKVLWYKNFQNQAEALFANALKVTKNKNCTVMIKIAETYITAKNKNLPAAMDLLTKALKLEPKNPEIHILIGDAMLEKNPMEATEPVKKYNEAAELDKTSAKPILRIGKIYFGAQNGPVALKWYKDAIRIDSTFAPAYIELGEIYLLIGRTEPTYNRKALEQYKKYLTLNNDLEARDRFAQILWVNKFYEDVVNEVTEIQKTDSSSLYLYRVLGYSYSEVGDKFPPDGYIKGLYAINKFFEMASTKKGFNFLASDYSAIGKLLSKTGNDSFARIELMRALEIDSTIIELLSDIAFSYYNSKKYSDAINYYLKKVETGKPTINDYIYLGLSYYRLRQFALADSTFKKVTTADSSLIPHQNMILATKWRAKSNVQLDLDSKLGLAKPYYEKLAELILAKPETYEKNKKDLMESYQYLGSYNLNIIKNLVVATDYYLKIKTHYEKIAETIIAKQEPIEKNKKELMDAYENIANYYIITKDFVLAKDYFTKIKEIDPKNKKAEAFFNSPEGKKG